MTHLCCGAVPFPPVLACAAVVSGAVLPGWTQSGSPYADMLDDFNDERVSILDVVSLVFVAFSPVAARLALSCSKSAAKDGRHSPKWHDAASGCFPSVEDSTRGHASAHAYPISFCHSARACQLGTRIHFPLPPAPPSHPASGPIPV